MAIHNLLIPKGDDFVLPVRFLNSTELCCGVAASTVPTVIKINPIGPMAIGEKLRYENCGELILTAPIGPLDTVATVASVPSLLSAGLYLQGNPIDITGWQGFSSVRTSTGAFWDAVCTIDGSAIDGKFKVWFQRSTCTIPVNCRAVDLFDLRGFNINNASTWGRFGPTSYDWDFDTIDSNNLRTTQLMGRALIAGSATV